MNHNLHVVYLVGVNHQIQFTKTNWGPEQKADIQALEDYLVTKSNELNIDLLAEEFFEEILEMNHATGCTVRDAAHRCEKPHLFCDATNLERESLGIDTSDKRENFWLENLKKSGKSSVLFVCGSDHLTSFSNKLNAQGVETNELSDGWGAGMYV